MCIRAAGILCFLSFCTDETFRSEVLHLQHSATGGAVAALTGMCPLSPADKQLDLSTVDLKKLKVKDLKKILEEWGESCKGCAEKSDFIRKITELMPKYAPAAAKARTEL